MPKTLSEWFCLAKDRHSFKPSAVRDRDLVFCHEDTIHDRIVLSIERRFAARQTVKLVLYGDWGVGKTHAINHLSWWFEKNGADFPARTLFVELGDIRSKSRFDILVAPFLDRLGLPELVRLVHEYQRRGKHLVPGLKNAGVSNTVAVAFGKLLLAQPGDAPPGAVATAFEFLKGMKSKEATSIGLGTQIEESNDFYSVLLACGELVQEVDGKQLIFIADEAAKLEDVDSDDTTRRHWVGANRLIFDDANQTFGFVYTLSGKGRKHIPTAISDPQIESRLGVNNMIELQNLQPTDVETFLRKLRETFVDRQRVEALVSTGEIPAAGYKWETYPFDKSGWEGFLDHWNRNLEDAKPRDICDLLDDVGFRALKDSKRLIDASCLEKAGV